MNPDDAPPAIKPALLIESDIHRFCLAHSNAFLVPAEALTENGTEPALASLLVSSGRLTAKQLQCLEEGFALYWQRCCDLYARAPRSWFAPRLINLLIASEERGITPYLEPFGSTSSMLYTSDLDTHPEYVAALLVHLERLSLLRHVPATVAYKLSYWFDRDENSRRAFSSAARTAKRPDAAGFVALAEGLGWVDELLHDPLHPPPEQASEPHVHIEGADLYVPKRLQPQLMALTKAVETAILGAMDAAAPAPAPAAVGLARASSSAPALDALCDWLVQARAQVIVQGPHGGTLWAPEHDDSTRVRLVLSEANSEAIASIHADLRVIDERSRQFLERVRDVDSLPTQCAVLETGGGVYIDPARRAVVYELQQPAFDTRAGAAPPYHRLLLGARVMHEWGHVAHSAKILHLPEHQRTA